MKTTADHMPKTPPARQPGRLAHAAELARSCLSHPRLPVAAALAAVLLMLPALGGGLFMDDLIQRVIELPVKELPPRIQQTGFGSPDNGKLGKVLCDLFGFPRSRETARLGLEYGLFPWWIPDNAKAALWRPFTAFTHWLDYRLFPNTPTLMHAHSILWFGLALFLVSLAYRKIREAEPLPGESPPPGSLWVPGLAALLFLLDKNTYFPVLFVANRGFIVALCFGLLCLYEHHLWRLTKARVHLAGSAIALLFSMLANEGGASTLAFLLAYALVFEPAGWRGRLASLLPAAVVIASWRIVYVAMGFGVANVGGYIDPGYEPRLFLEQAVGRIIALLGGQLSGVSPECLLVFSPAWRSALAFVFLAISIVCIVVFWPTIRADRVARFWFYSMLLALIPAATVIPLSKNMAFIAVGAFGVIGSFLARMFSGQRTSPPHKPFQFVSWSVVGFLLLAHVPCALLARAGLAIVTPRISVYTRRACEFPRFPEIADRDVIVVNNPCQLATMATPFVRAYYSEPLPASLRTLLPATTGLRLTRTSETTLVAQTDGPSPPQGLLGCGALGPIHACYAVQALNSILAAKLVWKQGDRVLRSGIAVHILETSGKGGPSKIAFHFEQPLDSPQLFWLWFDWTSLKYYRFAIPQVGESVNLPGPQPWRRDT